MSWVKTVTKTMKLVTFDPYNATSVAGRITTSQIEENHGAVGGIILCADPDNAETIFIGGPNVDVVNGIPLAAGEKISLPVFDPYDVYAVTLSVPCNLRIAKI